MEALHETLENSKYEMGFTWRDEGMSSSRSSLMGGVILYQVRNHKDKEIYEADYLFESLEWTKDEWGEEIPNERFNIWYHNWVFWVFAVAIGFSILRRIVALQGRPGQG